MSTYERIVGLLNELTWEEQLALIGVISERLRQAAPESPYEPEEETAEELPEEDEQGRQWLPRLGQMIAWGLITPQEVTLYVRGFPDQAALLLDAYHVAHQGERKPINDWAKHVKGWTAINIYDYVVVQDDGRTLGEIRREYMEAHHVERPNS